MNHFCVTESGGSTNMNFHNDNNTEQKLTRSHDITYVIIFIIIIIITTITIIVDFRPTANSGIKKTNTHTHTYTFKINEN